MGPYVGIVAGFDENSFILCNTPEVSGKSSGVLQILEHHCHFVFAWSARYDVSFDMLAVHENLSDSLTCPVMVLDGDFIQRATETAGNSIFLPLRTYTWIYLKAIICRLDA